MSPRADLTVTGITASDKVYDGTTTATLDTSEADLVGVSDGDDVTLDADGAIGTFASPDMGTGIGVTIAGLTLSGDQAADYALTPPTTTANINQATLTVTGITAIDRAYDGTTDVQLDTSAAVLNGVIGTDDVTLETGDAQGELDSPDVGNGITVTIDGLTLGGARRPTTR